jgi:hypothetical protein
MKGLARKNTHVKYGSPSTYQSKVRTMLKFLKRSNPKVKGSRSWYQMKGLLKRRSTSRVKGQRVKVMASND